MPRRQQLKKSALRRSSVDAPIRRRLPILLRHAWFSLNQTFRRRLAHTGVTPDQFTALRTLMEHEPQGLTQSGLTRLIASDPNTIARAGRADGERGLDHARFGTRRTAGLIGCVCRRRGGNNYERVREIAIALQTEVLAGMDGEEARAIPGRPGLLSERCRLAAESGGEDTVN